jgi:hypothetical protein
MRKIMSREALAAKLIDDGALLPFNKWQQMFAWSSMKLLELATKHGKHAFGFGGCTLDETKMMFSLLLIAITIATTCRFRSIQRLCWNNLKKRDEPGHPGGKAWVVEWKGTEVHKTSSVKDVVSVIWMVGALLAQTCMPALHAH